MAVLLCPAAEWLVNGSATNVITARRANEIIFFENFIVRLPCLYYDGIIESEDYGKIAWL